LLALAAFCALCTLGACGTFDYGNAPVDEVEVSTTAPNFAFDIKPLMELKCMNCHTATPGKFVPGDSYPIVLDEEKAFKALALRVQKRVFDDPEDPMPPNFGTPLTENEKTALKVYLAQLKAAPTPVPTPVKPGATVLTLSAAYTAQCSSCHQGKGEGEGIPGAKKLAGTRLEESVYTDKIRLGVTNTSMGIYLPAVYSDVDLKADYAKFKAAK